MSTPPSGSTQPYDASYPSCERTTAAPLVYPGTMGPEWVTTLLGLQPTLQATVGQTIQGTVARRVAPMSLWELSSDGRVAARDLRDHMDWLIAQLDGARDGLEVLRTTEGVTCRVDCSWWSRGGTGGPVLWPQQMAALARHQLELAIQVSFYGEDDERGTEP